MINFTNFKPQESLIKKLLFIFFIINLAGGNLFAASFGFTIDPTLNNSPIPPQAYGSNATFTDAQGNPVTNTFYRQGGNRMTAYNWENNASNSGADYCQSSGSTICSHEDNYMFPPGVTGANDQPATTLTAFVHGNNTLGSDSLITLQMAGFVSTNPACNCFVTITGAADTNGIYWKGVSFVKGSAFADPPVTTDMWVYMDELMHYLGIHLGYSGSGGAKYYDLDNEPALWSGTHPMDHPAQPTCLEVSSKGTSLATVITQYDPGAQILGPVAYGWSEYVNNQGAPDYAGITAVYGTANKITYLNYYLAQFNASSTSAGRRLLHYLDLHWYPEATGLDAGATIRITKDDVTPLVAIARMQAPRSLWDPTYVETSWITSSMANKPITLIPRLQNAVSQFYPGTKLSFSEYQYGAGEDISGGVAEADALGIFSKYGVMASWWPDGSVNDAYLAAAFRFYLNYDGANSKFGDTCISATSTGTNAVSITSVYAAKDNSHPNRINVIILNKDYGSSDSAAVTLNNLLGGQTISAIASYRFDSGSSIIYNPTAPTFTANTFSDTLPFRSATLYQITLTQSFPTYTPTTGVGSSPTNSPTPTPSNSPTKTATPSPTLSPTNSPTQTPSPSPTQTATNSPTPTITLTPTSTATNSPTNTPTQTATGTLPTATNSPTNSPTSTPTETPTITATSSPTNTPTNSPTQTPTNSATNSPTATPTSTSTNTATLSPTSSPTNTPTTTFTATKTFTPTFTNTSTNTPTITWTPTITNTPTQTSTPPNGPPVSTPIIIVNPVTTNGPVTVQFTLNTQASQVSLKVFTTSFRKVKETTLSNMLPGLVSTQLNLVDNFGTPLANGLYYLLVTAPKGHSVGKIIILR